MIEYVSKSEKKPRAGKERTHHIDVLIGRRLKELRDLRSWSQAKVGAGLGVSAERIGQMESGERIPASRLWQLCGLFGVGVAEIFEGLPQTVGPAAPLDGWDDIASTSTFSFDGLTLTDDGKSADAGDTQNFTEEISKAASGLSGLEQQVLLRLLSDVRACRK